MPYFDTDSIFWFCALAGTGMLAIQLFFGLIGTEENYELGEHDTAEREGSLADGKFRWLTRQTLGGFLMMFGWVGLGSTEQLELPPLLSLLLAAIAGVVAAYMAALVLKLAKKAHSTGSVFRIENAVGKDAVVYHRIPPNGTGTITLTVNQFTHELDAISPNGEEIQAFSSVDVVGVINQKTVIVVLKGRG